MYTYELNVGYSVLDESLQMTIPAILDCFQDAAIFETESGSITIDYLYGRNIAWLLSSWQIVIDRRPLLNEKIRIMTSAYDFKGFLGYRNFMLSDAAGNGIVKAASIWTLIDTVKMCPSKLEPELIDGYELSEKLDMDYAPRKIALLGDHAIMKDQFQVRKYQIDSNKHMNNVEYIRMAMETLPDNAKIRELRAEYKKAALYGDNVTAGVIEAGNRHQVVLGDTNGGTYAVVEFVMAQ